MPFTGKTIQCHSVYVSESMEWRHASYTDDNNNTNLSLATNY